jgi:Protein of unknown function (DUF3551)
MRTLFTAAFATLILSLPGGNVARADGSWCAEYFGRGGTNCGFHNYGQCKAAVSGVGGLCRPNPWAAGSYNYRRNRRY